MSVFNDNSVDDIDSIKTPRFKKERVIYIDETKPCTDCDTSSIDERVGDNFTLEVHGTTDESEKDVRFSGVCE